MGVREVSALADHGVMRLAAMHRMQLQQVIAADPLRMEALEAVAALNLPDCWIAAGFVRDAVWDHLHGTDIGAPVGDVDVVRFDKSRADAALDPALEQALQRQMPHFDWSVKNQARMHERNGDAPYASVADAMTHWPETATAVAVRLGAGRTIEVNAPFDLSDLFGLRLKPSLHFSEDKRVIFYERVAAKGWMERYPRLLVD